MLAPPSTAQNRDLVVDMVRDSPQTLTSLDSTFGLLMHSVISECDDHRLVKRVLDIYKQNNITPLLLYGPRVSCLAAPACSLYCCRHC